MKKIAVILGLLLGSLASASAQRFAYVDTEYIMNKIPAYRAAQEQLNTLSAGWQKEVDAKLAELDKLFKDFQAVKVSLSEQAKATREAAIIAREDEMKALQKKHFGSEGSLEKKQIELVKPIQDKVYQAIKAFAVEGGYALILDTAAGANVIYADPKSDCSDDILRKLGYAE